MTKTQVEVITSVQRRRRWSRAEKERIVAAALEPGAVASEVARAAGIHTSQLFRWRQELCCPSQSAAESAPPFSAVIIAPAAPAPLERTAAPIAASPPPVASSVVEVEFASGTRMRISGAVDPAMASAMIAALTNTKRRRRR
ncbi:MAG: IS66-like element accessory protein TnpA [Rhodoplanes sp.]